MVEADRIAEEYRPGQHGFPELVAVPWYDPEAFVRAAADVAGVPASALASDGHPAFGTDSSDDLTALRLALSAAEQDDLRALGADAAAALERALTAWSPGERDLDIQARVAAALEARGADAPVLIVGGDDRVRRYRHPMAAGAPVRHLAMAVVVARRGGLHAAATRFASAVPLSPALRALWEQVRRIEAATLAAGRPGHTTQTCSAPWIAATRPRARPAAGPGTTRAARSATPSASSRSPLARAVPAGRTCASSPVTRSPGTPACPAAPRPRTPTWYTPTAWNGSPRPGWPADAKPRHPAPSARSGGSLMTYRGTGARPARDHPEPVPAASGQRFPDGAHFRIEIPSVEGPEVLRAVIDQAKAEDITVNRVSQGSGAMLLSAAELDEMARIAADHGVEVSLFVGPREEWDVGSLAQSGEGPSRAGLIRGARQLRYAIDDVLRGVDHGSGVSWSPTPACSRCWRNCSAAARSPRRWSGRSPRCSRRPTR